MHWPGPSGMGCIRRPRTCKSRRASWVWVGRKELPWGQRAAAPGYCALARTYEGIRRCVVGVQRVDEIAARVLLHRRRPGTARGTKGLGNDGRDPRREPCHSAKYGHAHGTWDGTCLPAFPFMPTTCKSLPRLLSPQGHLHKARHRTAPVPSLGRSHHQPLSAMGLTA